MASNPYTPPIPVEQYRRARQSWLEAVEHGRSHAVVNALWEVVRVAASRLGIVPGLEV